VRNHLFFVVLSALVLSACGSASTSTPAEPTSTSTSGDTSTSAWTAIVIDPRIRAVVDAADRTEEDRALDGGRHPAEVFSFFGIQPGWHVADLFAGGGYSTELLARIVGPEGSVLSQNTTFVLDRFARAPQAARLARLAMPNITPVERDLDAPIPEDAHDLDAVIFILSYHDSVWQGVDRAAMNRAVFDALRPGGVYGIIDHEAAPGHGIADTESLHRIERSVVVDEILAAGFRLDAESDLLRNPDDAHDWNSSPTAAGERRGTSDRFLLRFVKP
jgi:predicted methyltransferase